MTDFDATADRERVIDRRSGLIERDLRLLLRRLHAIRQDMRARTHRSIRLVHRPAHRILRMEVGEHDPGDGIALQKPYVAEAMTVRGSILPTRENTRKTP